MEDIDKIIKESPFIGLTKLIIDTFHEVMEETVEELRNDIMMMKSFSYGEAEFLARQCFLRGIKPKSDEFYEVISKVKTLWE